MAITRRQGGFLDRLSAKPVLVALFLFCALPAGMLMALLTPPGQVPDEPNHLARAAGLLHGEVLIVHKERLSPTTGKPRFSPMAKLETGLVEASVGYTTMSGDVHKVFLNDLWIMQHTPPDKVMTYVLIPNTATYFPAAYLPATLGLAAGQAANLPPFYLFLLARLFMLAAFLALGAAAIALAEYGAPLLLALLILPMTLFLAGSVSEDGVLIAAACLAAALFTADPFEHPARRLCGVLVLVLVLASKPPYAPLLGLCLLPLFGPGLWRRALLAAAAALPVLLWLALVLHFTAVPFYKPPYTPGPLWTGDPKIIFNGTDAAANLHILLADPIRLFTLPWKMFSLAGTMALLGREMVGMLGFLQIIFPLRYYEIWGAALALVLAGVALSRRWTVEAALTTLFVLAVLLIAVWSVALSLYLNWTHVGQPLIEGFQGRYFLILLPFLILALPPGRGALRLPAIIPALPVLVLGIADLAILPMKLVTFFYLH
jgi:uncharacterized membrane protein